VSITRIQYTTNLSFQFIKTLNQKTSQKSHKHTPLLPGLLLPQTSLNSHFEHLCQIHAPHTRALNVPNSAHLLGQPLRIGAPHSHLALPLQALQRLQVLPQVALSADKKDTGRRAVVPHLRQPLGPHVAERFRANHAEAEDEHVRLRVGHDPEAVVLLLARGVPEVDED